MRHLAALLALVLSFGPAGASAQILVNPSGSASVAPTVLQSCTASAASQATATCTFSKAPGVGDRVILGVAWTTGHSDVITPPANFVQVTTDSVNAGAAETVYAWQAGASAATSYVVTQSYTSTNMTVVGVDISNGFTLVASSGDATSTSPFTAPAVAPYGYQALPIAFFSWSSQQAAIPQAGWTDYQVTISNGPSADLQAGPVSNTPATVAGSVSWGSTPNGMAGATILVGSAYSPPGAPVFGASGFVQGPAYESVSVTNGSWSCSLSSLCSIGTYTFKNAWASAPTCVLTLVGTTAANTAFAPVVQAVSTTTLTVYGRANAVASSISVSVSGWCFPT